MNMKLASAEITNPFTFTLFLDDVFDSFGSSLHETVCSGSGTSQEENYCQGGVGRDILTNIIFCDESSLASPVKNSSSKTKSTFIGDLSPNIPTNLGSKMKAKNKKQIKSFLSTSLTVSDKEEMHTNLNSSLEPSLSPGHGALAPHHRQSIFSHSARIEHLVLLREEKTTKAVCGNANGNNKVTGSLLKQSLKGKHFERIIKKLGRFVEIARVSATA